MAVGQWVETRGDFVNSTRAWLQVTEHHGKAAVEARYRAVLEGALDPSVGSALSLNEPA
jgi:hypothetical protein